MAKQKDELTLNIGVGIKNGNEIDNIETAQGSKSYIISFINNKYKEIYLKSKFKIEPVFNLMFLDEKELLNINNWFTIDELVKGGILELEEN